MINDLSINDLFETRRLSPLSDFDAKVVMDLYMPLVGAKAVSLYFALYQNDPETILNHEKILQKTGFSVGEMVNMLNALEAVALVVTYLGDSKSFRLFDYCLFAPLTPKKFFADPLFAGTFQKYVGKEEAEKLAKKYSYSSSPNNFKNVSMTFMKYFSPDLNDGKYVESVLSSGGKTSGKTNVSFDFSKFLSLLQEIDNRYVSSMFSPEEINYIGRVNGLYGYSVETLASFVNSTFRFTGEYGKRLNKQAFLSLCEDNIRFDYLKIENKERRNNKISGDTSVARVLRQMQNISPIEFLTRMQKGNKLAPSDISLIEELTLDIGLNSEVTNALLFYVLSTQKNKLPKAYTLKVGASLVREGLETALDTWNYFADLGEKNNKGRNALTATKATISPGAKETENDVDSSDSEESIDDIFASVEKR